MTEAAVRDSAAVRPTRQFVKPHHSTLPPFFADEANCIPHDGLPSCFLRRRKPIIYSQVKYITAIDITSTPGPQAVFGMNVEEIAPGTNGTLSHYASTAIPFTLLSIWIIIAFQSRYIFAPNLSLWKRLGWPVLLFLRVFDMDPYKPRLPTSGGGGMDDVKLEEEELELQMDLELNMEKIDKRDLPDLTIAEAMDSVERFR